VSPQDEDTTRQCLKLLEALEELDDVSSVSANLAIDDSMDIETLTAQPCDQ